MPHYRALPAATQALLSCYRKQTLAPRTIQRRGKTLDALIIYLTRIFSSGCQNYGVSFESAQFCLVLHQYDSRLQFPLDIIPRISPNLS